MAELDRLEIQIETSAKQASSQLDLVMEKLEKISNSLNGLNTSKLASLGKNFDTVSKSTGTTSKSVETVTSHLQSMNGVMNKSAKSTRSLSSAFGSLYANCFMIIRGIKKLGSAVEASMDYIETYNYFNVITDKIGAEFGSAWKENGASSAEDYANSFRDRLNSLTSQMTGYTIGEEGGLYLSDNIGIGLDPEKIMSYQANISSITNAVGLMGETSVNTSKALTMLAADLSSLKNQDLETVMNNLQSGLIGQSRALYKYGIDITNNMLQTYAYANGIDKAVSAMTQAEKMQLRLLAILDQSKVAYGDMANTIAGVANQYRILKQQVSNLARIIGNLFIPVLQTVLPYINGLIIALQRLFTWIGNLLGVKWDKLMDGISKGYTDTGLEALEGNADDVTDALDSANSAAKKLKNNLQGWHEINNISTQDYSSSVGGSVGGGIDLSDAIAAALSDYEKVWNEALAGMENKAQEIADKIAGFFENMWKAIEPFRDAVKRLWDEGLSKLGNFSWTALKDFYNEFLLPLGKWAFGTVNAGLTRLVDVFNVFLNEINWSELNRSLKDFWVAIEPYAEQFGEGLIDFFEDVLRIGADVINKIPGFLDGITGALNGGNPETARQWGYALGVLAVGLVALKGIGTVLGAIATIGAAFTTLSAGLAGVFGSSGIFATIGASMSNLFAPFTTKFGEMIARASGGAGTLGEAFMAVFGPAGVVTISLIALVAGLGYVFATNEKVRQSFSDAIATIQEGLQPIIELFTNTILPDLQAGWQGLLDILSPLGTFLEGAFTSIWQDIINPALTYIGETVLPELAGAFENLWNNVLVPLGEFLGSVLEPVIQIISDALTILWETIIVPLADAIGSVLGKAFEGLVEVFNFVIEAIQPLIDVLTFLWDNVLKPIVNFLWDVFKPVFEDVFKAIGGIIDSIGTVFGGLIDFITGIFTMNWEKAWNGIVDIFRGIFNLIPTIAESVINGVIHIINGIVDGFNLLTGTVGIPEIPDIPTVTLPRFADGGFPNTGEMFLARENGITEMVGRIGNRPAVANNDQIVEGIAGAVYPAVYNAVLAATEKNSGSNGDIVVQIDGREVFRATQKRADEYYKRTGNPAFSY